MKTLFERLKKLNFVFLAQCLVCVCLLAAVIGLNVNMPNPQAIGYDTQVKHEISRKHLNHDNATQAVSEQSVNNLLQSGNITHADMSSYYQNVPSHTQQHPPIQPANTSTQQSNTVTYQYDIDGNVISKTKGGTTIEYTVDTNRPYSQVLLEKQNGNPVAVYTHGDDLISQTVAGGTSYYGYDGHGSTKFLTNPQGEITDTYQYDAYGKVSNRTGTTDNNYLYAGEQYDRTLNQYHLRARNYNPNTGRMTQMDTWQGNLSSPVTMNKYLYAGADPINNIDPSGNMFIGAMTRANLAASLRSGATNQMYRVQLKRTSDKLLCILVEQTTEKAINGIYLLGTTGDPYVGRSVDMDNRYTQHKRLKEEVKNTIARFNFPYSKNSQRVLEQAMIDFIDDEFGATSNARNEVANSPRSRNSKKLRRIINKLDFCK